MMRGRIYAAAVTMLAGALWASSPAFAESAPLPLQPDSAAKASETAPTSGLGLAGAGPGGFSLFGTASNFGPDTQAFSSTAVGTSLSGHYTSAPILAPLESTQSLADSYTLRDFMVSARIAPGLEANFLRWSDPPSSESWLPHVAGVYSTPLLGGSGLTSPYTSLGTYGSYAGIALSLGNNLRFNVGRSSSSLGPILGGSSSIARDLAARVGSVGNVETNSAGLEWGLTNWAGVGFTASQTREVGSLLGAAAPGSIATLTGAETSAFGISARVGFGEGWVTTVAYNQGVTQLDLNRAGGSIVGGLQSLRTRSYGLAVAKQGVFGDDAVGIAVSRPLQTYGTNFASMLVPQARTADLTGWKTPAAESDFQVGYVTTFLDGALALQANAAYQMNANGDRGQDAVSVLSRAKIKF